MPTPKTEAEKANAGPKTPATQVDMDAPSRRPVAHGERKNTTDNEGRNARVMGGDETCGR